MNISLAMSPTATISCVWHGLHFRKLYWVLVIMYLRSTQLCSYRWSDDMFDELSVDAYEGISLAMVSSLKHLIVSLHVSKLQKNR